MWITNVILGLLLCSILPFPHPAHHHVLPVLSPVGRLLSLIYSSSPLSNQGGLFKRQTVFLFFSLLNGFHWLFCVFKIKSKLLACEVSCDSISPFGLHLFPLFPSLLFCPLSVSKAHWAHAAPGPWLLLRSLSEVFWYRIVLEQGRQPFRPQDQCHLLRPSLNNSASPCLIFFVAFAHRFLEC